jgi:cytochrome oxidase Cu insertion factor (SCO1/SenC/PrrC family)
MVLREWVRRHLAGTRRAAAGTGAVAVTGAVVGALLLAACTTSAPGTAGPQGGGNGTASAAAMKNPVLDTGSSLNGQPAPGFRLVNQFGEHMSLSQFRGKVVILAFVDSECTNVCPLTTLSMVEAKQLLGPAASRVQLLGVDANPHALSVADTLAYSRVHQMVNQWDFLTGTLAQVHTVWQAFHIAVQIDRGQIDHTPALFVIDPQGRERKVYLTQMAFDSIGQSAQVLAQEAASLLPGQPAVSRSARSLAYIPGTSPARKVTLPGVPSGTVTLGTGHAHLVVFFATWLAETSDLRSHLLAMNGYVKAARRGGLPPLVAVDEAATEPSPRAAAAYLKTLGAPLSYPVAQDASGRLADGYGVQDQPWFVLTSASGKIIWKHDGWLGVGALKTAARKAAAKR